MAGGEEYFEVTKEINKWFLDYLRLVTWEDFRESNHVTIGERDLIQGKVSGGFIHELKLFTPKAPLFGQYFKFLYRILPAL